MVLAAGLGARMRPLTDSLPKPLVLLAGRPLIDYVLDGLAGAGVERAVVNGHYCADALFDHLRARTLSQVAPDIVVSDERGLLLDTGGGVKKALPLLGREPFLVHNSDSIWLEEGGRSNLERMFGAWRSGQMDALLLLAPAAGSLGYDGAGDFSIAPDGRLRRRQEGERVPHVFAGVSIIHPRLFNGAPDGCFSLNVLFDKAIASGALYGVHLRGLWMHVGTPGALREAEQRVRHAFPQVRT
jgi:MurNAc alpha-1-phosphate uridylyltransferase